MPHQQNGKIFITVKGVTQASPTRLHPYSESATDQRHLFHRRKNYRLQLFLGKKRLKNIILSKY
jgi:hypothetical protein